MFWENTGENIFRLVSAFPAPTQAPTRGWSHSPAVSTPSSRHSPLPAGWSTRNTRSVYTVYDPGSCGSLSEDFQSPTTLDPSSSALLCLPSSVVRSLGNRCLERFDYFSQNHLFTCLLCQGAKIKEIRDLTGAQINVSQESLPDSNERTVEVKMSQI